MAEADSKELKSFRADIQVKTEGFFLKGSGSLGWGMKNRLSRIFNPKTGRTVMLAFDHGYIMGPTSGLERLDLVIPPLHDYIDVLMCTRGALRSCITPITDKPVCLRCSAGATILRDLSDELVGVAIEDAIRLNVVAITLQVFIKSYFCEPGFEKVVAGCPVPIVIAGGKKLPEADALAMCYKAIDQGALGVDMGRNIFQSEDPAAMVQAVRAVVHGGEKADKAFDLYKTLKNES